jgi:hypothetical protein
MAAIFRNIFLSVCIILGFFVVNTILLATANILGYVILLGKPESLVLDYFFTAVGIVITSLAFSLLVLLKTVLYLEGVYKMHFKDTQKKVTETQSIEIEDVRIEE